MERNVRMAAHDVAQQAVKSFGATMPPDLDQAIRFFAGAESMSARAAEQVLRAARGTLR